MHELTAASSAAFLERFDQFGDALVVRMDHAFCGEDGRGEGKVTLWIQCVELLGAQPGFPEPVQVGGLGFMDIGQSRRSVRVRLELMDVVRFKLVDLGWGQNVLSFGARCFWIDNQIALELGGVIEPASSVAELDESDFFILAKRAAWTVEAP
jgi:hypothetical protein